MSQLKLLMPIYELTKIIETEWILGLAFHLIRLDHYYALWITLPFILAWLGHADLIGRELDPPANHPSFLL